MVEASAGLTWGAGNIDGDPVFSDVMNLDFHLDAGSPCINRGLDAVAPAVDGDGDARPFMGTADLGMDEYTGTHLLETDVFTLSASAGGNVHFDLDAGIAEAGRPYLVFGSASGTAPGTPLPGGAMLPLNWDLFTNLVAIHANGPTLDRFLGALDGLGCATADLNVTGPIPGAAGMALSFAFALAAPWDLASNPVNVEIAP